MLVLCHHMGAGQSVARGVGHHRGVTEAERMTPFEPMGSVVVGIDQSEASMSALDLAAEEAAVGPTPLVIVAAHPAGGTRLAAEHDLLEVAIARALADHPALAVAARLIIGEPSQVLVAQSRQAVLLVIGHRGAVGAPAAPDGSVAVRVIHEATCPVIVFRPVDADRETAYPRPVLLGVDGRAGSDQVVEFAFQEAALRGAAVWGVHVWPGSHADGGIVGGAPDRREAGRVLSDALDAWSAKYPQVPVSRQVVSSHDVAGALTRASLDAQLAVVGSLRRHDRARPRRRGTARTLIDLAGCPVAVVPWLT
jgi:nucleotide-binding universal stress UspA family protein